MKITRFVSFLIALTMVGMTAACAGGTALVLLAGESSKLSGSAVEVLTVLVDDLRNDGVQMPMTLPASIITADVSQNAIGLSAENFDKYVVSASDSLAAIGTSAHQIVLIEAKDASSAEQIKKLLASDGGYDVHKWICVLPEKAVVVESENYVMLAASYSQVVDVAIDCFKAAAGEIGDVDVLFESANEQVEGGGLVAPGGAVPLPIGG